MEETRKSQRLGPVLLGLLTVLVTAALLLSVSVPRTKSLIALRHLQTPHAPFFILPPSQSNIEDSDDIKVTLDKRLTPGTNVSDAYQVSGVLGDGLYAVLELGSQNQSVLFSIDTTFNYLLANNYTSLRNASDKDKELSGFDYQNSSTFLSSNTTFNISNVDNEYAFGLISRDDFSLSSGARLPQPLLFGLTLNNSINIRNKNVVGGPEPQLVVRDEHRPPDNATFPANVLGLGMGGADPYALLPQIQAMQIAPTKLFSLYVDSAADQPIISFGSVDTAQYDGPLYMAPILKSQHLNDSDAAYNFPFIMLSDIILSNDEVGASMNLSSSPLDIPALLDTSSVMSYLPYSLLVQLATEFGAFYSDEQSIWIQSCSFKSLNGTIGFQFYDTTINISLSNLFVPLVNTNGTQLYLETGEKACALAFSPAEHRGFSSLGTPFFQSAYVVFDYTNQYVGLAQQDTSNNASTSNIIVVENNVGDVVSAFTMSFPNGTEPTATIVDPQRWQSTSTEDSRGVNINANSLLTSPPPYSSPTNNGYPSTAGAMSTIFADATSNPNAVSVSSGAGIDSGAPPALKSPLYSCVAAFLLFFAFAY